ncbi:MAG: hypothetical protein QG608_1528 [Actinomycetota bacterium]|nr:hypothetical protein [Actinomycetota bacterium]
MAGLLWVGLALVAAVLEVFSLDFVLLMFAGGALTAACFAWAGPVVQIAVFAMASTGLLLAVRPSLVRWTRRSTIETATGVAGLIGRSAEVLSEVTDGEGLVKLAGETWTARSEEQGENLPVGAQVRVVRIDGATAVVAGETV